MTKPRVLALFGGGVLFGQERGNIEALSALREQGCEVLCLVRDESWAADIPPALEARGLSWLKVPYIEQRMPGRLHYVLFRNPVAFVLANWRFLRAVREFRPTHIHAFNPLYVLNFLVALTFVRLPMVYRAGDEPTAHNVLWRSVWHFVVRRTRWFVANSRFVARALCRHGVAEDQIVVIYNAPPKGRRTSRRAPAPPSGEFRFAYVGQISQHKGVHVLVDAFRMVASEFPAATLVVAGRISEWSGDAWARQLRDHTASDPALCRRVEFPGEIDDVPALLSDSTVHVTPSLFDDPSPNVIMEAKQWGRASIVFARGGMPELVKDGVSGVVCERCTAECLAAAMRHYLHNPSLAWTHGRAAIASLDELGVPNFGRRWLDIFGAAHEPRRPDAPGPAVGSKGT